MKTIDDYTRELKQNKQFRNDCRITLTPAQTETVLHFDPKKHRISVSLAEYNRIFGKDNLHE